MRGFCVFQMRVAKTLFLFCCLLGFLQSTPVLAALQFNPTLPLTLGLPGDKPDVTRVAYNSRHDEYLVVYQYRNDILLFPSQIHAARLSSSGEYIANYIISDLSNDCIQPDVEYDPLLDRYLIVWSYDTSTPADGPYWDIYGRFVPWSGPVDSLPSFEIANGTNMCGGGCIQTPVDEKSPRIAYSQSNRDFMIVISVSWQNNPSYLQGYRVEADGTDIWKNLLIGPGNITPYRNPDVTYNNHRDEFLIAYDYGGDIFSKIVPGQQSVGTYQNNPSGGQKINMINPTTPLVGTHEQPAVSFLPDSLYYIVSWITNKHIGSGDIHARYLPGGNAQPTDVVYYDKLDPPSTWAEHVDVSCSRKGTDCLVIWGADSGGTYHIYGRQILLNSNPGTGYLTGTDTGFAGLLGNLGAKTTWAGRIPYLNVITGASNYTLGFTGLDTSGIRYSFARQSDFTSLQGWKSVEGGGVGGLGIRTDNFLWSWGDNGDGTLGLGDWRNRLSPTKINSPADWVTMSSGNIHSLALRRDGSLWSWGGNSSGQLGVSGNTDQNAPAQVLPEATWNVVNAGGSHSLAIRSDGSLYGWGYNAFYQLGLGDQDSRDIPTRIGLVNDWIAVDSGYNHSLAIRSDGSLWAWGNNSHGQLGNYKNALAGINQVGTEKDWIMVKGARYYSLGIRADGSLWAWGKNNFGQLGVGDEDDRGVPTKVGLESDWIAISASFDHSLGIRADGSLWAWGENFDGQLGLGDEGSNTNRNKPARVGTANDWVAISAGGSRSFGIRSDGSLWVWGHNFSGELGVGDIRSRNVPTLVQSKFPWNLYLPAILN